MSNPNFTQKLPSKVGAVSFKDPRTLPNRAPVPPAVPDVPKANVKEETTPKIETTKAVESYYERLDLPSKCVPYDFESISIRKVTAIDQAKITRAVKHANMSILLDALSATLTCDIRLLGPEDFKAVCYWHRTNSYLRRPINISWTSVYGNKCTDTAKSMKYETNELKKSRADYAEYRAKGFVLPTMGDLEILEQIQDEETIHLFNNAQYIDAAPLASRIAELEATSSSPSVDARIEKLNTMSIERGIDIYDDIADYAAEFDFNVIEKAVVADPTSDFAAARDYLAQFLDGGTPEQIEEYKRLDSLLSHDMPIVAKEEVHALPFNVWSFFPYV